MFDPPLLAPARACVQGMDLYFKRHDGQAVTCDDFLAAMADANGVDLATLGRCAAAEGGRERAARVPGGRLHSGCCKFRVAWPRWAAAAMAEKGQQGCHKA